MRLDLGMVGARVRGPLGTLGRRRGLAVALMACVRIALGSGLGAGLGLGLLGEDRDRERRGRFGSVLVGWAHGGKTRGRRHRGAGETSRGQSQGQGGSAGRSGVQK